MEKWETHLPEQAEEEVAAETKDTAEEAPVALEENETALNPRIQALKATRDEAERKLQEAILDLETREQSPAFQKAEELFNSGWRLQDLVGLEGFRHFHLVSPQKKEAEFAYVPTSNGSPSLVDGEADIFDMLGISSNQHGSDTLHYLSALTEETSF